LKMRKLLLTLQAPKHVLFNLLKNPISSERLRLPKEEPQSTRLLLREDNSLPNGHSNLTSRRTLQRHHVLPPTRKVQLIKQDLRLSARD